MADKLQSREWWYERGQMAGRWQQQKKLDEINGRVSLALIVYSVIMAPAIVGVIVCIVLAIARR